MVKTNTGLWRLFRQSTAVGVVLLLTVIGFSPVAEAGTWIRRDWSKVQRIVSGARTRVLLYKDRAPGGIREAEGQFQSASAEAIMLLSSSGKTLTLQKQAVEKVLVYRPVEKRYQGWVTAGVSTAIVAGSAAKSKDASEPLPAGVGALLVGAAIGLPTVIAFLASPKWSGIYNVPRKLRDDSAPTSPSTATKQSSSPSGSDVLLLEDKALGPELLRLQGRRALMRRDLPLDLSVGPVHAARSGID